MNGQVMPIERLLFSLAIVVATSSGCTLDMLGSEEDLAGDDGVDATGEVLGWDEFKAQSTRTIDDREIYVIEWDIAVSLEELFAYYNDVIVPNSTGEGPGVNDVHKSIVNRVGNADDLWQNGQQLKLTYCISDNFGASKQRAIDEMAAATADWEKAAHVDFTYLPQHDGSCDNSNASVTIPVRAWTSGGACAFFPSGSGCVTRTLVMNFNDFDTSSFFQQNAPNLTTTGVFRHELGHILGLRHEHTRPNTGTCYENSSWRPVSAYDKGSVMHYQWCNGDINSALTITDRDRQGIQALYGCNAHEAAGYDAPITIPDNYAPGIASHVDMSGTGKVGTVELSLNISHPWQGDLVVNLVSPAGTRYLVHNRTGGPVDNLILDGLAITTFSGQDAAGTWTLEVKDLAYADSGVLNSWSLRLVPRFDAADTPIAIPDNTTAGITSSNTSTGSGRVGTVYLSVDITHTWQGDLVVTLISPAGTRHVVHNRAGGSADNVILDDLAIQAFAGEMAAGTWQLEVKDMAGADVGTLNVWSLGLGAEGFCQIDLADSEEHWNVHDNNNPGFPIRSTHSATLIPDNRYSAASVMFYKNELVPPYTIELDYSVFDDDGGSVYSSADGISILFGKNEASYGTPPAGGSLGIINDGTGYAVKIAIYGYSRGISLVNGSGNVLGSVYNSATYNAGSFTTVRVAVASDSISVYFGGALQFVWNGTVSTASKGMAIGAATGGADSEHEIRNVRLMRATP